MHEPTVTIRLEDWDRIRAAAAELDCEPWNGGKTGRNPAHNVGPREVISVLDRSDRSLTKVTRELEESERRMKTVVKLCGDLQNWKTIADAFGLCIQEYPGQCWRGVLPADRGETELFPTALEALACLLVHRDRECSSENPQVTTQGPIQGQVRA